MLSSTGVDWQAVRREFPAVENWTYLNTATFGQMPRRASEAVSAHFAHRDKLACWDFLTWYDDADRLRGKIARLINCGADDIAFVPSASSALGILLAGIDWRDGDQVVTLEHEFPNNLYAPGMFGRFGVRMMECPWERLYDAVNERTRLVLISSVNYNTGFAPPLEELSAFLRARGVLLYVDGTQSVGALQFNTARIQPDMLAVHAYKWMLAPTGAGFVYVAPRVREWLAPNAFGWRSHHGWRNVDNLHHGLPELTSSAEKYEGGNLASALLCALEASVDMMLEIGPELIEQRVLGLAQKARRLLGDLGATVREDRSPIVAARFEGRDISALARALKDQRVLVAARRGHLRVSPHLYNDEEDLERLAAVLRCLL